MAHGIDDGNCYDLKVVSFFENQIRLNGCNFWNKKPRENMTSKIKIRTGKSRKGFTLAEVLVAFTLLMIGVMSIVPMMAFVIGENMRNKHYIQARLILEQFGEELRTIDYDNPVLDDDGDTTDINNIANPDFADTVVVEDFSYFVSWNIHENFRMFGVKQVGIAVSWIEPSTQMRRTVRSSTLKAAVSR